MGIESENSLGWERKETPNQRSLGVGFEKIVFFHQATAGDQIIDLSALVLPSSIAAKGFTNPSYSKLQAANLKFYRKNFRLTSSIRGDLWDFMSYSVATNSRIVFESPIVALDGEIFRGEIDLSARTGITVVEGRSVVASGELDVGQTDVSIPEGFTLNANPSTQIGALIVERNGIGMLRNENNAAYFPGVKGNYQETGSQNIGVGIKFNTPGALIGGQKETYKIYSLGLVAERPTQSMLTYLESIGGQVSTMIPYLAAACQVPASTFGANPTSIDLLAFAARMIALETVHAIKSELRLYNAAANGSTDTAIVYYSSVQKNDGSDFLLSNTATLGTKIQILNPGLYSIGACLGAGDNTIAYLGLTKNAPSGTLTTSIRDAALNGDYRLTQQCIEHNLGQAMFATACVSWTGWLAAGDIIRPHSTIGQTFKNGPESTFHIARLR